LKGFINVEHDVINIFGIQNIYVVFKSGIHTNLQQGLTWEIVRWVDAELRGPMILVQLMPKCSGNDTSFTHPRTSVLINCLYIVIATEFYDGLIQSTIELLRRNLATTYMDHSFHLINI